MKRTTIHLSEQDTEALAAIRERFGLDSAAAAIRFAVRRLLREIRGEAANPSEGSRVPRTGGASAPTD